MSQTIWNPTGLCFALAITTALLTSSCTTQSQLAGTSNRQLHAVTQIGSDQPAEVPAHSNDLSPAPPASTDTAVADQPALPSPASPLQVQPAPSAAAAPPTVPAPSAATFTSTPVTLTTVPRTPVATTQPNQIMMVRTTAYSHLQADSLPYGRKSAAGNDLKYGSRFRSAAADWSKYPVGTRFKIEGMPYDYVIDDYGSALVGSETIDIYKPNLDGIGDWGVRNVPIQILEWGCYEKSRRILDSRKHVKHAHHVRKMLSEIERKQKADPTLAIARDVNI